MFDATRSASDLSLFIGTERDPLHLIQTLTGAGLLLPDVDSAELIQTIRDAFSREAACPKPSSERRAHIHLDYLLEPFLSEKGQELRHTSFGEKIGRPNGLTELNVGDLMSTANAMENEVTPTGHRFFDIKTVWVANSELGAQMEVHDNADGTHINKGELAVSLEYGFIDGVRIYRTSIQTIMRCDAVDSINAGYWPRRVFNNTHLHHSQAEAYFKFFQLLLRYDDRHSLEAKQQGVNPSQSEIDQLLSNEHNSDLARAAHDSISAMWPGDERDAATKQFLRDWYGWDY